VTDSKHVKPRPTVLMANPSADIYGADIQLLESATSLLEHGWRVVVVVPTPGPLVARLKDRGVEVELLPFPVLRRADLSARGLASLVRTSGAAMLGMRRLVQRLEPDLVYVNTVTLPWWLLVARWSGLPRLCHVHEAESRDPAWVRRVLAVQLGLADATIVNSRTTLAMTAAAAPYVRRRLRLVLNGIRGPAATPVARKPGAPYRLVVVGRISPRKAPHVALEATALLRAAGRDVVLELCGTPAPGHEAYLSELCVRAEQPDLAGFVTFAGYQAPIWQVLERTEVVLAPSTGESFGNAVVEGQLARRPVVATAVQGHVETVEHGITGLLVPDGDAGAMAAAVAGLMDRPKTAQQLAFLGMRGAEQRFGIARYASDIAGVVAEVSGRSDLNVVKPGDELLQREPQQRARRVGRVREVDDLDPYLPEAPL
jgi:glycosyltransferase involved in cell wall biosynthesis